MPGISGKWWSVNPITHTSTAGVPLNTVGWQPFWSGSVVLLRQVQVAFPSIQETAGNVLSFALYADRGDLWPGSLVRVLGEFTTTTTAANTAKTLSDIDQTLTPNTVYWLASLSKGGTVPVVRVGISPHPLIGLPDTSFVRTNGPASAYNLLTFAATDFPASAGDESTLIPALNAPRLTWQGT